MTDDLLTSDEVRAILRVERTALAGYLVGPDRIPHRRGMGPGAVAEVAEWGLTT